MSETLGILDETIAFDLDRCAALLLFWHDQRREEQRDKFSYEQRRMLDMAQSVRISLAVNAPEKLAERLNEETANNEKADVGDSFAGDYRLVFVANDAVDEAECYDRNGARVTPEDDRFYFDKEGQPIRVLIGPPYLSQQAGEIVEHV